MIINTGSGRTSYKIEAQNIKSNTEYTISAKKTRIKDVTITNQRVWTISQINYYNDNELIKEFIPDNSWLSNSFTSGTISFSRKITTPENCNKFIVYFSNNNGDANLNTLLSDVQVEKGEKTDFIQHQEQIVSFPLSKGQVLHEEDYLSEDGIHQNRKTITANGTTILLEDAKNNGKYLCSQKESGSLQGKTLNFDENITNAIIEYELEEEIITPYTPEQQEAYNKLKNLLLYEGYTKITCLDEMKPDIQATYYFNNEINNIYAKRIDSIEEKLRQLEKLISSQSEVIE